MPENITPQREALPSIEQSPPSPALKIRIARGEFDRPDPSKPIDTTLPQKVDRNAFIALENLNNAKRKADQNVFIQKYQRTDHPISLEDLRHVQMGAWMGQVQKALAYDLQLEGRGDKTAIILRDKLGFPLTGNGPQDGQVVRDQLYNSETQTEGAFYKKFCARNMPEQLANALSIDDMMHLKTFLVTWMLGSEADFAALVALKQTMDDVAHTSTKQETYTQYAHLPLDDRDKAILMHFRKGLQLSEEKTAQQPSSPAQPEVKESPKRILITGEKTEPSSDHPEKDGKKRNDDRVFFDKENLRGGIFDGAGGYTGGDIASRAAQETIQQVMATLPANASKDLVKAKMEEAFSAANNAVKLKQQETNNSEASTTAAVFQIVEEPDGKRKVVAANIGDSRVWIRKADGSVVQVTRDWNRLRNRYLKAVQDAQTNEQRQEQERIYEGATRIIDNATSREELANQGLQPGEIDLYWNHRNETPLLGSDNALDFLEFFQSPLEKGDIIFMTTDGVHDNLTLNEIAAIAKNTADPQALSDTLVVRAKAVSGAGIFRSKLDDITAAGAQLEE